MNKQQKYTEQELREMARKDNPESRRLVAQNQDCPEDLLRHLAKDVDDFVRASAAKNINIPTDLLRHLGNDSDQMVRASVARNKSCDKDLLRYLAIDDYDITRANVACNTSSPLDVVIRCLSCYGTLATQKDRIQEAFNTHQGKLIPLARSGELDFDMVCADGETLKNGLINGGQVEILNILLAEFLAGKAERLAENINLTDDHNMRTASPTRRI
jgi:hypothetical protein